MKGNPEPHLRVARPTEQLAAIVAMYRDGLDFELIGSFEAHEGFDGAMLGAPGGPYHLEFTQEEGGGAGEPPSPENLLVFYIEDEAQWSRRCDRMAAAGFAQVPAHNPYWDRGGRTFVDLDGYRVVIYRGSWG
ncbi:VOC family protein [Engelhardtia mirabilis]|uniref:Uncharacterized protein n=1 Tax=Engelhardtia mirabilis TaxID=2528011 RepID=A0A518BQR0_9BACT|nr:hypothetical protein Pla133_43990 [Planctomycetes bacterium Pla133]QDV03607.1 hypothetical protein Pla86_43980 [Planctomycetes bacterium Pla86]